MLINNPCASHIKIKDAVSLSPFKSGLEYSAPARGAWNIVHTGFLLPDTHEIFVCAQGCLRGVVLTAAEMGTSDRFSTVAICESNVTDGDMEDLIFDGVSDILSKLNYTPRAVLVYTSCIHHFIGCDLPYIYDRLRKRFPHIDFTDCYMNPIMRKSGLTPDQIMRRQLYSLLKPCENHDKAVNIIGCNIATDNSSELLQIIKNADFVLRDIALCKSYDEYLEMGKSVFNITYLPVSRHAGEILEKRLGQRHLYLPLSYNYGEITENLNRLSEALNTPEKSYEVEIKTADAALENAFKIIGNAPIAIDYTATPRPLSLARLLISHGFNVVSVYSDGFIGEEAADFEWLKLNRPELDIFATVHTNMRLSPRSYGEKLLAIGQKAAYFTGTNNFVNIVEGGGMYGFDGIRKLATLMTEAFLNEKIARELIQIKGLGCSCQ